MMCTRFLFVVALFFLVESSVVAEAQLSVGSVGQLITIGSLGDSFPEDSEKCGPYFAFTHVSDGLERVGVVKFTLATFTNATMRIKHYTLSSNDLQVRVVDELEVPIAKIVRPPSRMMPWVEISIGQSDFEQAPCLLHSTLIGLKIAH